MILFAFVLFAVLIVAWLVAPNEAPKTVAKESPVGMPAIKMGDATV